MNAKAADILDAPAVVPAPPLKLRRIARGWRQVDLAVLTGLAHETICRIERGQERPRRVTARALANALECEVDDLFDDEDRVAIPGLVTTSPENGGRHGEEYS